MIDFNSALHPDAKRFIEMIDQLGVTSWSTRYTFFPNDKYEALIKADRGRGMQIYWNEILARAHLASATAILRARQWIEGMRVAATAPNLLAFAAAFRGLIESAADSSTALGSVPLTLARDHPHVLRALAGEADSKSILSPELEDTLIHYSYARHLTKAEAQTVPSSHKALKVRDYIDILKNGQVIDVIPCYQALCDLTHPGATSVWMWLHPTDEHTIEIRAKQDEAVINNFMAEYRRTFIELLMFAFNPALATLRVLNYFPLTPFHTAVLEKWNMSRVPIWRKSSEHLKGVQAKTHERLKVVKPNLSLQPPPRKRRG